MLRLWQEGILGVGCTLQKKKNLSLFADIALALIFTHPRVIFLL